MLKQQAGNSQPPPPQRRASISSRVFHKKRALASVIIVVVLFGSFGGYYVYQNSLQPNMQVTTISIAQPLQNPASDNVVNLGRVTSSGSISYAATLDGSYVLTFDNRFSDVPKSVAVTYSVAGGPSNAMSFTVPDGGSQTITVHLSAGQSITGSFTVAGGPNNEIEFRIIANTCTEAVSFSFSVVNAGSANGFATVAFQVDGQMAWSNKYFAQTSQQLPASGTLSLDNCASHNFNIAMVSQQKA